MKHTLLIVDDDSRICDLLCTFLERHNFSTLKAPNVIQARGYLNTHTIDLILLDIMMPGSENGLDLAKQLRRDKNNIPIIFLTARDELQNKIDGLNAGADDYVLKPFEPTELLARINTILRRATHRLPKPNNDFFYSFGDAYFCMQTYRLLCHNKNEIGLTSTEQVLLKILSSRPYDAFSRKELATRSGFTVHERTIDVQITRLRRKLQDNMKYPKFIKTIRHIGYALYPDNKTTSQTIAL
jgi:two-component system phosphate regulon response regulator OmpR